MAYYQVVGYSWDHWINKEVSRVTGAAINHVSIRVHPFCGDDAHELYVSWKDTDVYVPSKLVERFFSAPIFFGRMHQFKLHTDLEKLKADALWWEREQPGKIWKPYFYHYIGRHVGAKAPWTCTKLVQQNLVRLGHNVTEQFYPNKLIQEYIKETY